MFALKRCLMSPLITVWASSSLLAAVKYVNSDLEDVMRYAQPGDTIIVAERAWSEDEDVWIKDTHASGQPDNYITVMGAPGTKPTLEGGFVIETDYWRFINLHFRNGANLKLNCNGGQAINCSWVGSGFSYAALTIAVGVSDILVEGCYFEIANKRSLHHAIYAHAADNVVIRNNLISSYGERGMKGYGIHIYDENKGKGLDRIAHNYLIENNTIHGAKDRAGIIIGYGGDGAELHGVVVRNNVIYNCNVGIYVRNHVFDVKLYNNTIFNMVGKSTKGIYLKYFESNVEIKNNIIYMTSGPNIRLTQPNDATLDIDNNLYYPSANLEDVRDKNPIVDNPDFVSTNKNKPDLHLKADSPAIDAGIDLGIAFSGSAPDLGAYEYGVKTTGSRKRNSSQSGSAESQPSSSNPFNPKVRIEYQLSSPSIVRVRIFDIYAREVAVLVDCEMDMGSYSLAWNGTNSNGKKVTSGLYFYRIDIASVDSDMDAIAWTDTRKMVWLR